MNIYHALALHLLPIITTSTYTNTTEFGKRRLESTRCITNAIQAKEQPFRHAL